MRTDYRRGIFTYMATASTNRAAENGAVPVYVFPLAHEGNATFQGYDAIEVVYRKLKAHRTDWTAPDTITYNRVSYPVRNVLYGCGVNRVKAIFVKGVK